MTERLIGFSTGAFYKTPAIECIPSIRDAGFTVLELCAHPAHLDYHDPTAVKEVARLLPDLGLEAFSIHAPFGDDVDITSESPSVREQSIGELLRVADAAEKLGVRNYLLHPGPERGGFSAAEWAKRFERAAEALDRLAAHCSGLRLGFVLENMLPHLFAGRARDLLWLVGALNATDIGFCLDTGHAYLAGELSKMTHKLAGHLKMAHVHDNHATRDEHLPPGEGRIAWHAALKDLRDTELTGPLILELGWNSDPEKTLGGAVRAREFLQSNESVA